MKNSLRQLASLSFVIALWAAQAAPAAQAAQRGSVVTMACSTADLRGYIGEQSGAAGSIITTLVLRNVSARTCTVYGYPGISLVDGHYRQIGQAARRSGGAEGWIVLIPGASASTLIRTLNPGTGTTNCLPASVALRVYPPEQRTSLLVSARLSECLGVLDVRPLVAGTSGSVVTTACSTADLRGYIGEQSGAAGSIITTLVLRNVSARTCTVYGYPGISLVDGHYRQIGQAARRSGGAEGRIVLIPGASASTLIRTLNPGTGTTNCLPASVALRVYPPEQRTSLLVSARLSECLGVLDVRPLVAGTSGS